MATVIYPAKIFSPDDLLGRDFIFYRFIKQGAVRTRVTIVGFDSERGWRMVGGWRLSPAWVPDSMFRRLLDAGVLEVA